MFFFRYLLTISTSTIIALGYSLSLLAQETPAPNSENQPTPGANSAPLLAQETPAPNSENQPTPGASSAPLVAQETPAPNSENQPTPGASSAPLPAQETPAPNSENQPTPGASSAPLPAQETPAPNSENQPTPGASSAPLPENINQNANPLYFPTQPEQVETDNIQSLTLEQAIQLARRNNQELQVAQLNLKRSREQLKEALAAEYPTLATELDFTRTNSAGSKLSLLQAELNGQNTTDASATSTAFNGRLELSYILYSGGRRSAQIRASEKQVRFNQLDVERIFEQTRLDVTTDYYNVQDTDAKVRIEQAAVDDANQSLRDAELLEKAGLGTKFDVLRSQVDLSNAQQRLILAISDQRTAKRQLVQRLGLAQNVQVVAADAIEVSGDWDLSLEETIILAYKNRAELEQFVVQRDLEKEQELIEIAAIKPEVSLFTNYDVLEILDDGLGAADGLALGARVRWTFFDGGSAKARRNQNKLDGEIAETRFSGQRDQIRFQVEESYFKVEANKENIGTARKAVELADESLRLARLRFQAGVGTQLDVINAQTELTRARGNLLSAVITYNQQLANLQRAVSNLPDNRLFDLP